MASATTPRPFTPNVKLPDGGTRITVKRCCNGCSRQIGDVTLAEIHAGMNGQELPDVRDECGCIAPPHHVETFTGSIPTKLSEGGWGYQCFTCGREENGYLTIGDAEAAGSQHQSDVWQTARAQKVTP